MIELRPTQIQYVRQRVQAFHDGFRHNLALLGPAGVGKTTVVHAAVQAPAMRLPVIECQLQREPLRDFSRRIATAVLRAALDPSTRALSGSLVRGHPERGEAESREEQSAALSFEALSEQAASVVPATTAAIEQLEGLTKHHASAELFSRALDLVAIFQQERQQPCVLILDEVLHVDEFGLTHAFHELGKRVMTWPLVLFILTSSSPFRARQILHERLQLLFGQFEVMPLGPIEPEPAVAWMQRELSSAKRYATVMRFLLHWIGTSPWHVHVFLDRMKELHLLAKSRRSDASLLFFQAAWDVLGRSEGALHQWCAGQVERVLDQPDGPLARDVLIAVAQGLRTTQAIAERCGTRRRLPEVLQALVEQDLIERKGACWVMPNQLLACWLTAVLFPRLQQQGQDHTAVYVQLEQALKKRWADWAAAMEEPFAQRIGRLMKQFRNETVSLDSKPGRMPVFQELALNPAAESPVTYVVADGEERRWCCLVHEGLLQEQHVAEFEQFCKTQAPKPSRKVVVAKEGLELNAKLLAKNANMWVWEPTDLNLLCLLYGQSPF